MAGRLMAKRVMGKLAFMRVEDVSGPLQLYVDKAQLEDGAFAGEGRSPAPARAGRVRATPPPPPRDLPDPTLP